MKWEIYQFLAFLGILVYLCRHIFICEHVGFDVVILLLYVDDIIILGSAVDAISEIINKLA